MSTLQAVAARQNIADFGMDTVSLAGPLEARLAAIREAGFGQVMLAAADLVGHPQGVDAAVAAVRASGLRVTGFQVLRDFEGLSGRLHDYKVDIAKQMILLARAVGARVLLACSSTSEHAEGDPEAIARDLRKLAMLALPHGVRVAYEALSWGRHVNEYMQALQVVDAADCPNLGLAVDSYHVIASGSPLDGIDYVDPSRLYLVQLADFMFPDLGTPQERRETARHFRVFPGEGVHTEALTDLVLRLDAIGYRGDYSFEVFNDDYRQLPQDFVAARARDAALWLAEGVLKRSVPLPGRMRLRGR